MTTERDMKAGMQVSAKSLGVVANCSCAYLLKYCITGIFYRQLIFAIFVFHMIVLK